MKALFIFLLYLSAFVCFSQTNDSEIVGVTSHYVLSDNRMIQIDTVLIQINNRSADTEILIQYSKGDKVSIDNVWIEDFSGKVIRKLKKNEIKDRSFISNISLYEDDFVKYFDLKHDVYPYRIYYTSKILYAKSLNAITINLSNSKIPRKLATLIIESPLNDSIKFRQRNVKKPTILLEGNAKKYVWKYSYTPSSLQEINYLQNDIKAPLIQIVPLNFKYGESGSFASWQTFGNWVYRLNKNKDKLPPEECKRIDMMLNNIDSDKEKVQILYRYLQDYTRYINVSINLGGLQTYPASYVCVNKYGDCKALTNYLQSMLKYAGIKSYYTLIRAGTKVSDVEADFPSQAFNHVILTVPLDRDTVFLECTDKNIPFGYLGTFTQNRQGLLIDEDESRLIATPALQPKEILCSRVLKVNALSAEIEISETLRGYKYEYYNFLSNELNNDEIKDFVRNNTLTGTADLLHYAFENKDRDDAEIKFSASFRVPNIYKEYGKNAILSPLPFYIPNYETPDKRTTGVQIDYPEFYQDTVIYEIPDKQIANIPENVSVESEFGKYQLSFEHKGNKLLCYKAFLLYTGRYSLDNYTDFFGFISAVKNSEHKNIHLELK